MLGPVSRDSTKISLCATLRNVASVSRFLTVTAMSVALEIEEACPGSRHSFIVAISAGINVGSKICGPCIRQRRSSLEGCFEHTRSAPRVKSALISSW